MGYYMRIFCTAPEAPSVGAMLEVMKSHGFDVDAFPNEDLESQEWEQTEFSTGGKALFLSELNYNSGTESLAAEEIEEFIEFVEEVDDSPAKKTVEQHLRDTKFVIANQILDQAEETLEIIDVLNSHLAHTFGGMVQADGEGFYDGEDLIVELE